MHESRVCGQPQPWKLLTHGSSWNNWFLAGAHPLWQSRLQRQLSQHHACPGVLLRRLQHKRVACCDGYGVHPQRHHGGEVEGADARAHLQPWLQCTVSTQQGIGLRVCEKLKRKGKIPVHRDLQPGAIQGLGLGPMSS